MDLGVTDLNPATSLLVSIALWKITFFGFCGISLTNGTILSH